MSTIASPLDRFRDAELTLEDLAAAAARMLRRLDVRPADGRVAALPDERGVRYYQTLGVVDRPLRYDGRRAVYGYRHLLQLIAVKRLQQEGHPLQLIQQALAGRSVDELEQALRDLFGRHDRVSLAAVAVPPLPRGPSLQRSCLGTPAALRSSAISHTEADQPLDESAGAGTDSTPHVLLPDRPQADDAGRRPECALVASRVAPGVIVTIDTAVRPDPDAVIAAITQALARLQKEP